MNEKQELEDLARRLRAAGMRGTPLDILERGDPDEIAAMQAVVAPLLGRYRSHDAFAQMDLALFADRWPAESAVEAGFRALQAGNLSDRQASDIACNLADYEVDEKYFVLVRTLLIDAESGHDLRFQLVRLLAQFTRTPHAREAAALVVAAMKQNSYSFLDVGSSTLMRLRAFDRRADVRQILETSVVHPEVRRSVERRLDSMERAAAKATKARPKARPDEPKPRRAARTSAPATSPPRASHDTTPKAGPTRRARERQVPPKTKATAKKATAKKPATSSKSKPRAISEPQAHRRLEPRSPHTD